MSTSKPIVPICHSDPCRVVAARDQHPDPPQNVHCATMGPLMDHEKANLFTVVDPM